MAGPVPAIGRGSLPLLLADTRPAMTVRLVSSRAGRPTAGVNSQGQVAGWPEYPYAFTLLPLRFPCLDIGRGDIVLDAAVGGPGGDVVAALRLHLDANVGE